MLVPTDDYQNHFAEEHPDCLFQKKQQLRFRDDQFQLPHPSHFYQEVEWEVPELLSLKIALNNTKGRLNNLDLKAWHNHTRNINNTALVLTNLKSVACPEFCSVAWTKFTEMLHAYPLIPTVVSYLYKEDVQSALYFNSVHLCEAPGAFISAMNHFLVQNMPRLKWDWVATTLSPYFEGNHVSEMINEDKLILGSWKNWTFLKDGTGDILVQDNIRNFADVEIPSKIPTGLVHLVTADGSIDCQQNPGEQEALVAQLHLAEILTALKVLCDGGSFVLKIFTFLECETVCHLYLLASIFREVHLFKPATSKEGNSEVYVICNGYIGRGLFKDELEQLLSNIEDTVKSGKALFPQSSVDPIFLSRLLSAAEFFTGIQISVIERNLRTLLYGPKFYQHIKQRQMAVVEKFFELCPVKRIGDRNSLFRGIRSIRGSGQKLSSQHVDVPEDGGTLTAGDMARTYAKSFPERLKSIKQSMDQMEYSVFTTRLIVHLEEYHREYSVSHGKPYKNILSSRFCYSGLLAQRQDLRDLVIRYQRHLTYRVKPLKRTHTCNRPDEMIQVFELLSNLTEINSKVLQGKTKVVCFHEFSKNFLLRTDMDVTVKRLITLIETLEKLDVKDSVFLCEYPLLTRLHVGLIFLLTKLFTRVSILMESEANLHGVFLHEFKGFTQRSIPLKVALVAVKTGLKNYRKTDGGGECPMEIVNVKELCVSSHWQSIFLYNTSNLVSSIKDLIGTAKRSYQSKYSCGPILKKRRTLFAQNK